MKGKPRNHYMEVKRYEEGAYGAWDHSTYTYDPEFCGERASDEHRHDDDVKFFKNIKLWKHGFIFFRD